jgi:hypothetical protein
MFRRSVVALWAIVAILAFIAAPASSAGGAAVPQGTQSNAAYAASFAGHHAKNVSATTQQTSCYRPEAAFFTSDGPNDGYTGMTECPGATTGEALGPYATQAGSNAGYPAATAMLVKDHSESDIRVDPTNARHLIGQSKWFVSAEGYDHILGFFESFDGGLTWPNQGHVPGYEGWTDNTDPVGAFDRYGNFYSLVLPYQFFYTAGGGHDFAINPNKMPNPSLPSEAVGVAVRPHGASSANAWLTTRNGGPDYVAMYPAKGREPDKQWITIDANPASPFVDRIYAMWVVFTGCCAAQPYVATAQALPNGTHTDWSAPIALPQIPATPQGATYLLPHVAPDGSVWTTLVSESPAHSFCCATIFLDSSKDGGATWTSATFLDNVQIPPSRYTNTTFRDGILQSFGLGSKKVNGHYPLYISWEDGSTGFSNVFLAASFDEGAHWTAPIQVNDNVDPVDEFQPNVDVAANGTVSVAFYDRRLACPAAGTPEATAAGIALDQVNPNYTATPPFGATNYCVDTSVQFYSATLTPKGHNIRLSAHSWDPQLNAPHTACATCVGTFIGDYFGIISASGSLYTTSVSTYDDGANPAHYQQQIIGIVAIP